MNRYPYNRQTRQFATLKITGGIFAFIVGIVIYLAVIAAFILALVWGAVSIVHSVWEHDHAEPTEQVK